MKDNQRAGSPGPMVPNTHQKIPEETVILVAQAQNLSAQIRSINVVMKELDAKLQMREAAGKKTSKGDFDPGRPCADPAMSDHNTLHKYISSKELDGLTTKEHNCPRKIWKLTIWYRTWIVSWLGSSSTVVVSQEDKAAKYEHIESALVQLPSNFSMTSSSSGHEKLVWYCRQRSARTSKLAWTTRSARRSAAALMKTNPLDSNHVQRSPK